MKPAVLSKPVISWILYDFANSAYTTLIVTFIYATYFTQEIAPSPLEGTAWWSRGVTITAFAVAILSPILGAFADRGGRRKFLLFIFTLIAVVGSALLYQVKAGQIMQAMIWFVMSNIAFEMGSVFYNSYLPDIAPPDKIGRISGYGWAVGYVGGLLAMLIAMVGFVNADSPWFGFSKNLGENIRATNLLVAVWFAIFSIPIFIYIKDKKRTPPMVKQRILRASFEALNATFKEIKKYRPIVIFLLARLIYNDGLITIFAFGGIYAAGTFAFSFEEIMIFGVVLNISAGVGAFIMGFVDDRIGGKKAILISLIALTGAAVIAVFAPSKLLFWIAGILVGIFSGPNQAASRSLLGRFVPEQKESEFFGFFAFSGKFSAFLGPLLLGLLTEMFKSQRAGFSIVILFFMIGGIILLFVKESQGVQIRTSWKKS